MSFNTLLAVCLGAASLVSTTAQGQNPTDPGPRGGPANAGGAAPGLGTDLTNFFLAARARFLTVDSVSGGIAGEPGAGLGPTFNGNSCAMCHAQPDAGGTSPHPTLGQVRRPNPQIGLAALDRLPGRNNVVPSFITANGPVREARFIPVSNQNNAALDGKVHNLFTISGRIDAAACTVAQPDFAQQLSNNNVSFRIPTPLFGLGLVENTPDAALLDNLNANQAVKAALGVKGALNTDHDGAVARFGWKAESKSLLSFVSEHYNVEQGVSNEGSPAERSSASGCVFNTTPEDSTRVRTGNGSLTGTASDMSSDVVNFAAFIRLSASPTPTTATASELNGSTLFGTIGCNLCHSMTLVTALSTFPGQSNVNYHPYSDFALHHMGSNLADGIVQGDAGPDMFRTAPLWGASQRIFFLHDGRTSDLLQAIRAHSSPGSMCTIFENYQLFEAAGKLFQPFTLTQNCGSEANGVIANFDALSLTQKQDLLNFLRSL